MIRCADPSPRFLCYHLFLLKTIAATAAALGVDEKTVKRNLDAFEAQMGGRAFVRSGRGYIPTRFGEYIFYRHAQPTVEGLAEIQREAHANPEVITIGASEFIITHYLRPLLRLIYARWPGLVVHLRSGTCAELEQALIDEQVDLIIVGVDKPNPDLNCAHALSMPVVFLVARGRNVPDEETVWRELAPKMRLVCPPPCEAVTTYFHRERLRRQVAWASGTDASSTAVAACLAALGDCVAVTVGASKLIEDDGLTALRVAAAPRGENLHRDAPGRDRPRARSEGHHA